MTPSPPELLTSVLGRYDTLPVPADRPLVTLTFAQSIDAKIAGQHGKQLILSGKESMILTHWMRTMHDAILVGIGTALNDDPQLNARHLPPLPEGQRHNLPRPIVIDSRLRLPPTCKLLNNYRSGRGRRPWVICVTADDVEWRNRREMLEKAGARVIQIPIAIHDNQLTIHDILYVLRQHGIRTLMVEGGARIIASFASSLAGNSVINSLIITVAPALVGTEGVAYGIPLQSDTIHCLEHVRTDVVGKDTVVAFTSRALT
ncbi:5-amino-6-(5-phosphoribosylamino)uracil reductase [Termitomyces sp. T112]|nr:5-amino-6-(5-phosphoribosylamino)uracil reductase [Termitomyces sp. T112]